MIMCVLLCYPVSIHMSQLLSTGRPISSLKFVVNTLSLSSTLMQHWHLFDYFVLFVKCMCAPSDKFHFDCFP